ncbi:hypothetical protein [Proteiniborus sp. MB09-C3]|uniref:hypothetical protein n=1 Tax=Proteiniborus sp. MB09-C3 TaxID=3050072 RepID=UPI002554D21B|nr:hypothetical protein [Proteiniborus sp. MB09-C3]WIV13848.1 hypothetical protein QO263_09160 [Proteiniborus sp. MB09-C3]
MNKNNFKKNTILVIKKGVVFLCQGKLGAAEESILEVATFLSLELEYLKNKAVLNLSILL